MPPQPASAVPRPPPVFMLPPPLMFGAAFAVGALVQHYAPLPDHPLGRTFFVLGAVILAAGVCLGATMAVTFLVRRTTLNPFANPSAFVAEGPYRLSRNPMYLSLVTAYLGGALMFGSVWPLVTLLGPVVILSRFVIPFEEDRMQATFGESYRAYRDRVRRWI